MSGDERYPGMMPREEWAASDVAKVSTYSCGKCGETFESPHDFYDHYEDGRDCQARQDARHHARRRLGALTAIFDRRGYSRAELREARGLADVLGGPPPAWAQQPRGAAAQLADLGEDPTDD